MLLDLFSGISTTDQIAIIATIVTGIIGFITIIITLAVPFITNRLQRKSNKQDFKKAYEEIGSLKTQLAMEREKFQQLTAEGVVNNDAIKQLVEQGNYQQAEKLALENRADKTKEDDLLLFRLSYLQYKHQEAIHRGEALLSSGYQGDAEFYFMLGTAYGWLEQHDNSISNLAEAIKLNPDYVSAHSNLGVTYEKKGEYDKAKASYNQAIASNQAIKLKPDDAKAHIRLGNAYSGIGDYDRAIELYNQAIKLKPDYAVAHHNLGNTYARKGDYDKAIASYNQALELKPDDASAHNGLGATYHYKEEYDKAIASYNQALAIDPNHKHAKENLELAKRRKAWQR
jgi:tetratricopeptide (TPR) repeat protein